jgi:hypothetical protein
MYDSGDHLVVVYRGSGTAWETARVIGDGFGGPGPCHKQLRMPMGLRLSGDGCTVCVADWGNHRASVFRVGDGGFVPVRHIAVVTELRGPWDVEKVEGGWLVACRDSHCVEFMGDYAGGAGGGRSSLGALGSGDGEFRGPVALAVVPGLGFVVREFFGSRLQVFSTADTIAKATMSPVRVAWMVAVARAVLHRRRLPQ